MIRDETCPHCGAAYSPRDYEFDCGSHFLMHDGKRTGFVRGGECLQYTIDKLVARLKDLANKEKRYRLMHDIHTGQSPESGYAWDQMRKSGDKARAALAEPEQ